MVGFHVPRPLFPVSTRVFDLFTMSVVRQNILSNSRYPQTITLRRVPAEDAARQLLRGSSVSGDEDTTVVGIAYHVSETGAADFICLANLTSAFIISFDPKSNSFGRQISALLCADVDVDGECSATTLQKNVWLVGFGMARIAIQVKQATSLHVMGIDLSTLFSPNTREPHRPSRVITEFVDRSVNRFEIEKLWMDMNGSAERDTVLQAWLAAWYAFNYLPLNFHNFLLLYSTGNQHKTVLTGAEKLYTNHINPSVSLLLLSSRVASQLRRSNHAFTSSYLNLTVLKVSNLPRFRTTFLRKESIREAILSFRTPGTKRE